MAFENIQFSVKEKVARLVLSRPPVNVMNMAMMREMTGVFEEVAGRKDVRVLAISGEGKGFSAGVEVAEHIGEKAQEMIEVFHGLFRALETVEIPVVAVVHGMALGGGCELVSLCDIVLVAEESKIGQPEIQVGVFPPVAAAAWPRRMGWAAAADLIFSGRTIRGAEAVTMGLASRCHPGDALEEEAETYLGGLASLSRPVLRATKRALRAGGAPALGALDDVESVYLDELMKLEDAHEGLTAFLEKRSPRWKDR